MNWMTIASPMVAAACLTLGLIELRISLSRLHVLPAFSSQ